MASRLNSSARWLRWLTPGLQIKRWLLLLMISELVLVLGVAYALKEIYQTAHLPGFFFYLTLQFLPYWARAIIFGIFGVGLLLVSYLKLTQSILGPFLPGNSTSSVIEVIHAFRLRGRGPRVVAIGGGTGLSSLLRGLKTYTSNLSAIVTVADDGGSSGRLRDEYRILPPGDFRQCLIALADAEPLMKQLFDHRFKEGSLNGHAFGNLFIMAMADVTGNFEQALRESGKVLAVKGTIVPSTLQDVTLVASINGGNVEGESKIPKQNAARDPGSCRRRSVRFRAGQHEQPARADGWSGARGVQACGHREASGSAVHTFRRRQRADSFAPRFGQAGSHDHAEGVAGVEPRLPRDLMNAWTRSVATAT